MAAAEVEIYKPRTDKREYRRIVLRNSLEVLLISDPETDKCAASMDVRVGSFSDPEGLEGLAHFLEHMLFYASEKYPEEDGYSKYVSLHGGSTNAFTCNESTNYFFDINADSFEEALDRFSQFFIKPRMSADAVTREIKAVDSEFRKNLLSDGHRLLELQKCLSKEDHPYHKFTTGNWDTLEVKPKAKELQIRDEVIKFYNKHYSANIMRLVIYAKESLDNTQKLVEEKFHDIQNSNRKFSTFPGQPCTPDHLQILVRSIPITEGHVLYISWPITPNIHHYKEAPSKYLCHLIGHEGEGSLFHALKTLGWATSLDAGKEEWTSEFSFFEVSVDLTDAGNDHVQDVIGLLFKYIQLVQHFGVNKWIFDEISAICETRFHYQDKVDPIDYVVSIASHMQIYPVEDWLIASSLPRKFSPAAIQMVLDQLSTDNVRIFWASKKFEGHTDKVEPWYNTAYSIENITSSMIQNWMQSSPAVSLHLPVPNVFIPSDFSLIHANEVEFPVLLKKSTFSELWYKPDAKFFMPRAIVDIRFLCPHATCSLKAQVLTSIFTSLISDYLNEHAYYAGVADLYYGIGYSNNGFEVNLSGYNHKLRILLETVIGKIADFDVKPDRFFVIKERMTKEYQNMKFQQPYEQAEYYCSLILLEKVFHWTEALEVLTQLEAEDLTKFVPDLLSRISLQCYIAGNLDHNEAKSMIEHVEGILFGGSKSISRPLLPSQRPVNRAIKLGKGKCYFYLKQCLNSSDENSALVHYIQVHRDNFAMNAKLQLFAMIASQPAFHQLRTVQQLGYVVSLSQRNDFGVYGLQFTIQSKLKGPGSIDSSVASFLVNMETKLQEMTNDEFERNVAALIDAKLEKFKNLSEEFEFYCGEIYAGTLKFDRREAEVAELRRLTKEELLEFFENYIRVGSPKKMSLSARVYGNHHLSEYTSDQVEQLPSLSVRIDDIFSFKRSQPLHGSF